MPPCLFGVGRKSVSGSLFTSILEYVERQHCLHKVSCDVLCVCVCQLQQSYEIACLAEL